MMKYVFSIIIVFLVYTIPVFSCPSDNDNQERIDRALKRAGSNAKNLQRVLDHFKGDELKYKAACFLIENMGGKGCQVSPVINHYIAEVDSFMSVNPNLNTRDYRAFYEEVQLRHKNFLQKAVSQSDIENVTANYLITNIESAFEVWNKPWAKDVSFDLFCKYVLPYRIGEEPISNWRDRFKSLYEYPTEQLFGCQDNRFYKLGIYSELRKKLPISIYTPKYPRPEIPLDMLPDIHVGNCKDAASFSTAQLRSLGIPSTIDFVPQWANRSMGHSWCVIFINDNTAIPFGVGEEAGAHFNNASEKKIAKVFRYSYQNNDGLAEISSEKEEPVPELFKQTGIIDVTSEYVGTSDVVIGLNENSEVLSRRWIFLAVFDNQDWVPIWFAKNEDGNATFSKLGRGVAYLPFVYGSNGDFIGASNPFIINDDGQIRGLSTDVRALTKVILSRKYPESKSTKLNKREIIGGTFLASNDITFKDSMLIGRITDIGEKSFSTLTVRGDKEYKYLKYVCAPDKTSLTAEIMFYDTKGEVLRPFALHTQQEDTRGRQKVMFDGNLLSSCNLSGIIGKNIIIEFEHPTKLSYIQVFPRSDGNFIERGDHYSLYYWDNDGWSMIEEKDAPNMGELEFGNIPENALLLLCDDTKGKEERIFTLEKGKQIWW